MINLSSFIAFHARRTPDRCALKYCGEDISYAEFDGRIGRVGGWLASRWSIQRLMGVGMGALGASLLWLPLVRTYAHVVIYGAAMGISGGIVTVVFFSVWGQVYGRQHLGKIQGCAQMLTVFASAIGPLLLAETLQRTGSYDSIFYGLAVVVAALGVGSWMVRLPARKAAVVEG